MDLLPVTILSLQLTLSAKDTRESRDGLALCHIVNINTQTYTYISPNDSRRKYELWVMAW